MKSIRNKLLKSIPFLIIIGIILNIYRYSYDLKVNGNFTIGKIKNVEYSRRGKYILSYEYYVDGKRYIGNTAVYKFECLKSNQCLEHEFKVIYSSKDPTNSEINLSEFEKHKSGTRFLTIDWNKE